MDNNYLYSHISTNTTTTVCGTGGILHAITVNTAAAGSVTIYDGATVIGVLKTSVAEQTYFYDVCFSNSLIIVTAAGTDLTVAYRPAGS